MRASEQAECHRADRHVGRVPRRLIAVLAATIVLIGVGAAPTPAVAGLVESTPTVPEPTEPEEPNDTTPVDDTAPTEPAEPGPLVWVGVGVLVGGAVVYMVRRGSKPDAG